jgi:hypothetical protein
VEDSGVKLHHITMLDPSYNKQHSSNALYLVYRLANWCSRTGSGPK